MLSWRHREEEEAAGCKLTSKSPTIECGEQNELEKNRVWRPPQDTRGKAPKKCLKFKRMAIRKASRILHEATFGALGEKIGLRFVSQSK